MTPAQHPRDRHDTDDTPRRGPSASGAAVPGDQGTCHEDERPRYGIRAQPAEETPRLTATSPSAPGQPSEPSTRTASAQAARRMGRGLSFTVILLGLLAGLGLLAAGTWLGWLVGGALVVAGLAGYALVQTRALAVFREPWETGGPQRRPWSRLWLIPAALLLLGLGCFATAFVVPSWLGPSVPPDLLDDYILAFVVGGMTMVVGAGLGFGLVATARLTRPDDDDSPLRPTDYAERVRCRDRHEDPGHYDSDWITREHRG